MRWLEALDKLKMASSPLEELMLVSYNPEMPWFSMRLSFYYLMVRMGGDDYEYTSCALMKEVERMDFQRLRWHAGLPRWIDRSWPWSLMSVDQLLAWNSWRFDHPNTNSVEDWNQWSKETHRINNT